MYFSSSVIRRKEKRYVDLAASRGELIEVSIEAVFEPMVQGYIIFPSIISIIQRLAESVKVLEDGTVKVIHNQISKQSKLSVITKSISANNRFSLSYFS